MKLTNLQLNVITNSIFKKIETKVENFKTTKEYQKLIKKEKLNFDYDFKVQCMQQILEIDTEIKRLRELRLELCNEYKTLGKEKSNFPYNYSIERLGVQVEQNVLNAIYEKYPSRADIETEVILASIEKGGDLIKTISKKLGL